ncbi:hypothetical protein LMG3431_02556 [Achromobacter pestifer]|uniref:Energy transducer TonB n=1 Tax=Achromobacter pestifer TaxID=1353889 RepID=A0A6S6Z2Q1_9BURK|nr:hypothetical protein LMG3431_02556 [Achromobacter pestifer]
MAYAGQVKARIETALSTLDDTVTQRLRAAEPQAGAAQSWVARVWVDRHGTLSGLELDEQAGSAVERELRALLVGMPIGESPPEKLRLPIIMRLDWTEAPPPGNAEGTPPVVPH